MVSCSALCHVGLSSFGDSWTDSCQCRVLLVLEVTGSSSSRYHLPGPLEHSWGIWAIHGERKSVTLLWSSRNLFHWGKVMQLITQARLHWASLTLMSLTGLKCIWHRSRTNGWQQRVVFATDGTNSHLVSGYWHSYVFLMIIRQVFLCSLICVYLDLDYQAKNDWCINNKY